MKLYVAVHNHRHGNDVFTIESYKTIDDIEKAVVERLGDSFEPNRSDESIEIFGPFNVSDIWKI